MIKTAPKRYNFVFSILLLIFFGNSVFAQEPTPKTDPTPKVEATPEIITGKAPVIIIPGITGSTLVNEKTDKTVWFSARRAKDDDIRLPISPNLAANRDSLVARDIIRGVKILRMLPEIEIYEKAITALEKRGGYREAKWDDPQEGDDQDTFYVFAYDWRRDNVENARLLITRIEAVKKKLNRPDLKFNIVAHSMGGLISRYAAMYGNADISNGVPRPTWAGANHIDKVFLVGTPNEGSILALEALQNGLSYIRGGINLPFIRDITRFDVFTIPALYQLLPHEQSLIAYDEDLKPMELDIYNPATWDEYDWSIWKHKNFEKRLDENEQKNARAYFRVVLKRSKDFQTAINARTRGSVPVSFYLMGSDCKETQNAIVLYRDEKRDRWITLFKPTGFTKSDGTKITANELKPLMLDKGDGVVPQRSLAGETFTKRAGEAVIPITSELKQCEPHSRLLSSIEIQDRLLEILRTAAVGTAAGVK